MSLFASKEQVDKALGLSGYSESDRLIEMAYDCLEGREDLMRYHQRHGTPSMLILTQHSPTIAAETSRKIEDQIAGKIVVEIGAGVGFLALELARRAKRVYAIESDPAWSWIFTQSLYAHKPENLTWIFGTAESVVSWLRADVAVILTRSGEMQMRDLANCIAPIVLMPLQDDPSFQRED